MYSKLFIDYHQFLTDFYKKQLKLFFNYKQSEINESIEHQIVVDCKRSLFKFKHLYQLNFNEVQDQYIQYFLDFWSFLPQNIQVSYLQGIGDVFEFVFLSFTFSKQTKIYTIPHISEADEINLDTSMNTSGISYLSSSQTNLFQAQIPIVPDQLLKISVLIAIQHFTESQFEISYYLKQINDIEFPTKFTKEIINSQLLKLFITQGLHCSRSINFAYSQSKLSVEFGILQSSLKIVPMFKKALQLTDIDEQDEIETLILAWKKFEKLSYIPEKSVKYGPIFVVFYCILIGMFLNEISQYQ